MLSHTGSLWHYLGSFVGYTLLAIGLIYGAYWFLRKQPNNWLTGTAFQKTGDAKKALLEVEANLALEPRKNLYVVRAGQDRFLISTTMEQTQCLAKLTEENELSTLPVSAAFGEIKTESPEEKVTLPWFAKDAFEEAPNRRNVSKPGLGARLAQSVQWLLETRKR